MMTLTPEQLAAIDRLGEYNGGRFNAATNQHGFAGDGYKTQFPAACNDVATAAQAVGTAADQVTADVTQVALDKAAASTAATTATNKAGEAATSAAQAALAAAAARATVYVPAARVGGTASAIVLTPTPAVPAWADGLALEWVLTATITGATTVAVSGLTPVALLDATGAALVPGATAAGTLVRAVLAGGSLRLVVLSTSTLPLSRSTLGL